MPATAQVKNEGAATPQPLQSEFTYDRRDPTTLSSGSQARYADVPEILSVWKHPHVVDVWDVTLAGMSGTECLQMSYKSLASFKLFRRECVFQISRAFKPMKQYRWDCILAEGLRTKIVF
jgi:hypothetical protein